MPPNIAPTPSFKTTSELAYGQTAKLGIKKKNIPPTTNKQIDKKSATLDLKTFSIFKTTIIRPDKTSKYVIKFKIEKE